MNKQFSKEEIWNAQDIKGRATSLQIWRQNTIIMATFKTN